MQVLLLHLAGGFALPLAEGTGWGATLRHSPFWLLLDGESAVFLFFLLSGWVLRTPFSAPRCRPRAALLGRAFRLGVPAAASALLAFLCFRVLHAAHEPAAESLGGSWLATNWLGDGSLASLAWEAGPAVLLFGFAGAPWPEGLGLPPVGTAYNAPLWTLSVEMWGSALLLALAALRARGWRAAPWLAALLCLRSPLLLFLLGWALAGLSRRLPARGAPALALPLALAALWLGTETTEGPLPPFAWLAEAPLPVLPAGTPLDLQREAAALLLLLALMLLPRAQALLARPGCQWLGRYSFPLYLAHWPMVLGPGAAAVLAVQPWAGLAAARLAGAAVSLGLTLPAALLLARVDQAALAWARRLRQAPAPVAQPA